MEMRIEFDADADAAYIYFKDIAKGEVDKTISLNESIKVDIDKNGITLGIEVLNASKHLPLSALKSAKHLSAKHATSVI